jgi:hypothetical protein
MDGPVDPGGAHAPADWGVAAIALLDQVAWDPRAPAAWFRRTRTAFALNEPALEGLGFEADDAKRLRLCATPLSWLRALDEDLDDGTAGPACLLETRFPTPEGRYLRDVLWGAEAVVCDDEAHAKAVYAGLRRRPPAPRLPEVFVVKAAMEAEADPVTGAGRDDGDDGEEGEGDIR